MLTVCQCYVTLWSSRDAQCCFKYFITELHQYIVHMWFTRWRTRCLANSYRPIFLSLLKSIIDLSLRQQLGWRTRRPGQMCEHCGLIRLRTQIRGNLAPAAVGGLYITKVPHGRSLHLINALRNGDFSSAC